MVVRSSECERRNRLVPSLLCLLAVMGSQLLLEVRAWAPSPRLSSSRPRPPPSRSSFVRSGSSSSSTTAGSSSPRSSPTKTDRRRRLFFRTSSSSTAIFGSGEDGDDDDDDVLKTAAGDESEEEGLPPPPPPSPELSEAEKLKRAAERIRLEAQEMEIKLIDEKLAKLNKELENADGGRKTKEKLAPEERLDLIKQIQLLEYRLDPEKKKEETEAMLQKDREERTEQRGGAPPQTIQNMPEGRALNGEETVTIKFDADTGKLIPEISITDSKTKEVIANYSASSEDDFEEIFGKFDEDMKLFLTDANGTALELDNPRDCLWTSNETEFVGTLSGEDLATIDKLEGKWEELLKLRQATLKQKNPFDNVFGGGATAESDADEEAEREMEADIDIGILFAERTFAEARAGNISKAELDLVTFANSATDFCVDNLPFVVEVVMNLIEGFKVSDEDPLYMSRFNVFAEGYDSNLFSLRRNRLEEGAETAFCREVLDANPKLFKRTAKPQRVGSAFLFDGKPGSEDGHQLVRELKEALERSSLKGKLNLFYLRDPSPQIELDEIQQADYIQSNGGDEDIGKALELVNSLEPPALLITGTNLESDKPLDTRVGFTAFALLGTITTIGSYYYPGADPNYFQEIVAGLRSPILPYLLGNLAVQHAIQVLLAFKGGFKVSPLPTLIPGLWGLPLVGSSISVNSPPKSKNDMFDFAFAGSIVGFLVSYGMIVVGLEHTLQATGAAEIARMPHFELDELKRSFLTSATIESVMGTNVLLSLGDGISSAVPLDPMVIAGYLGLMINAIQMIPTTVETNGGRASSAALGRFSVGNGGLVGLTILFLLVQAYRGGTPALNFVALIYTFRFYFRPEMPCENDVDEASPARLAALGIGVGLAFLALSPA